MTYKIATNLPLDLYFVLDFSTTMEPRLASLAGLTQNLSKSHQTFLNPSNTTDLKKGNYLLTHFAFSQSRLILFVRDLS